MLLKLIEALGCRDKARRRDECRDWRIIRKLGHIYALPGTLDRPEAEGFQIHLSWRAGVQGAAVLESMDVRQAGAVVLRRAVKMVVAEFSP